MLKSELRFEDAFLSFAQHIGGTKQWEYRPDIKNTEQLWANFREILALHNPQIDPALTDGEFAQVQQIISDLDTPYLAGKFLYGLGGKSQIQITRDDGTTPFLTVFDQKQVGAGDTIYQVVNQIERDPVIPGKQHRRFDVTFLVNGLPLIQVEEKLKSAKEALNQMQQYIAERQYTDIFSTLQILVGMTPHDIRYMANTTLEQFNTDFAFNWQDDDNNVVMDWKQFANLFLNIPMAHYMATTYMILDGTPGREAVKVMRPYQMYATKRVVEAVKQYDFSFGKQELGYVWHTTGSGKTISSFKAAWLLQRLPNVDAVIFMVDRVALTNQTAESYAAYDPDSSDEGKGGVVSDTANTDVLRRRVRAAKGITVTSIQKMDGLVRGGNFKAPDKHYVFIVDEAHRSVAGKMMKRIKKAFPQSGWIGYTGTPSFDDEEITTEEIFGIPLHTYTIKDAIKDRNVLGFSVDFETTIPKQELEDHYLPKFYKQSFPEWTEADIAHRISQMSPEDMDDMIKPGVYDNNPKHVELVVKDVLDHWRNRSQDYRYSALFTTHVGGNQASTPMAMMYYDEFKKQIAQRGMPLRIAVTFSSDSSNGDNMLATNSALSRVMADYSKEFGGSYDSANVREYAENVVARLRRTVKDQQYLDLVIVVDQLLTGFDAPMLNTLYVDRVLRGKNLIQAYSRTNRIENNMYKEYGNIVSYRWPNQSEKFMNEALAKYSDRNSANVQTVIDGMEDDGVLAKPYEKLVEETATLVKEIKSLTKEVTEIPGSELAQAELLEKLQKYSGLVSQMKTRKEYDYNHPEKLLDDIGLTEDQEGKLMGPIASGLRDRVAKDHDVEAYDVDLTLIHVKDVEVKYDYLMELLAELANAVHEGDSDKAQLKYEEVETQASQMDDRKHGEDVRRAAKRLLSGELAADKYPVSADSMDDLVQHNNEVTLQAELADFIKKWGLLNTTADDFYALIQPHVKGADDMDNERQLTDVIRANQDVYAKMSSDPKIQALKKIQFRKQVREAIKKFADRLVDTYDL